MSVVLNRTSMATERLACAIAAALLLLLSLPCWSQAEPDNPNTDWFSKAGWGEVEPVPLKRLKITFGRAYATQFEFRVSVDGQTWQTVAQKADHDGSPFEATFGPVPARHVRVCALKPDGPDQPGSQMSVAELEAYQ